MPSPTPSRPFRRALAMLLALAGAAGPASARVSIVVDLSSQTMDVTTATAGDFHWKVSTGRSGFETPGGTFHVMWTDVDHHSKKYDDAPMPYAIFFQSGYAIHGTASSRWGSPASHGCVRLPVPLARELYGIVQAEGPANTTIRIVGSILDRRPAYLAEERAERRRRPVYRETYVDSDDLPDPRFRPRSVEVGPEPIWPGDE